MAGVKAMMMTWGDLGVSATQLAGFKAVVTGGMHNSISTTCAKESEALIVVKRAG